MRPFTQREGIVGNVSRILREKIAQLSPIDGVFVGLALISVIWGFYFLAISEKNPLLEMESYRDYVIARHIATGEEFPVAGPRTSVFGGAIPHSPAYYYYLALLFLISSSTVAIKIAYIACYFIGVISIYLLAKELFNLRTGLVSVVLYSSNPAILETFSQSSAASAAPPFVLLSLFFLAHSYKTGVFKYALWSIVSIALAWSIYSGGVTLVLPVYTLCLFLVLKQQKTSRKRVLGSFLFLLFMIGITYAPVLFRVMSESYMASRSYSIVESPAVYISSIGEYAKNIYVDTGRLLRGAYVTNGSFVEGKLIFVGASLLGALLYLVFGNNRKEKLLYLLSVLFVLQVVLLLSVLKVDIYTYHFAAVIPIFFIIMAYPLSRETKKAYVPIFVILILVCIIKIAISGTKVAPYYDMRPVVSAIETELRDIQKKQGYGNFTFFEVINLRGIEYFKGVDLATNWVPFNPAIFIWPLEKSLDERLVRGDHAWPLSRDVYWFYKNFDFIPTTNRDYLVFACQGKTRSISCIEYIKLQFPDYEKPKFIYSDSEFLIYIARQSI